MLKIEYNRAVIEISDIIEDGGFIVRCLVNGDIRLFEIPQYGGEERFYGSFKTINEAIETGMSWT